MVTGAILLILMPISFAILIPISFVHKPFHEVLMKTAQVWNLTFPLREMDVYTGRQAQTVYHTHQLSFLG